ncbi:uncharacterized protein [Rutidosis leptorrhynchoides]|uniref:uncharacterized protein isoform X2 n=1 Tax=Rutidosis leptorrhynchoides TaxID=125765 RepID=UPI003A98D86E
MESAIKELAHLHIPLDKILDATNNFSHKRMIGKGGFGKVYRGKFEHKGKMIKIAARRLDRKYRNADVEFWTEVSTLSSFKRYHFIVAMVGFCDEKGEKIVINHHYPKGSLSRYINDPMTLDVDQRLAIAEMISLGIIEIQTKMESDYIIHRNINSFTILLDENWDPRLSGFEYSIRHSRERMNQVVHSKAIGTRGYIDPAIEKYGGVNFKSDIYSVGVVLFELLCGRNAFQENTLLAPLVKFHYENGTMKYIVHPDIWNQMNSKSFECFSKAAYACLHEDPTLRPEAEQLLYLLTEAKDLQKNKDEMHENEMREMDAMDAKHEQHLIFEKLVDRSLPDLWKVKVKKWEHLRIELTHIHIPPPLPIMYYTQVYKDRYHHTFKQEIEYYDKEYVAFVEQKNKDELPKKRQTVATKSVLYEENVFLSELETLDNIRHPNIQSLLGFYHNGDRMMLFYEYVSDKCVNDLLDDVNLTWKKRIKICVDVAHGLDYLHNGMEDQKMVIHGDINGLNIKLDDNFGSKIIGFQKSVIVDSNQNDDFIQHNWSSGYYTDPEYVKTHKLKRESDVFSFGVVMFEMLCGMSGMKVILDEGKEDEWMASLARRWSEEGIIKKKLATVIKEENSENILFLKKGPNEDSLNTFTNITFKCLAESQNERPNIKVVLKELQKALSFQENHKDHFKMAFNDIKLATEDFSPSNCIGGGGFGLVYKGKLVDGNLNEHFTIVVKKLDKSQGQGEKQYYNELQILCEYNHENIIGLIGYSNETAEKLIVYEHASKGSLDKHLDDPSLTWRNRLQICIDVATGLNFLHEGVLGQDVVIHRDIKTANILLFDDWKAKIGDFGLSLRSTLNEKTNFAIDHPCGTNMYVDPMYLKSERYAQQQQQF